MKCWLASVCIALGVACSQRGPGQITAARTYMDPDIAVLGTQLGQVIVLRVRDGKILSALEPSTPSTSAHLASPISIARAGENWWYSDGVSLYEVDQGIQKVIRWIQLYPESQTRDYSIIAKIDADCSRVLVGTTNKTVLVVYPSESRADLLIRGLQWERPYWDLRLVSNDRMFTVGDWPIRGVDKTRENPRGLSYGFIPNYQDGISLWELKTARRIFRVDRDGQRELWDKPCVDYALNKEILIGGVGSPDYLLALHLEPPIIEMLANIWLTGEFAYERGKLLQPAEHEIWLSSCAPYRDDGRLLDRKLTALTLSSSEIQGLCLDRPANMAIAWDADGSIFGISVDWDGNRLEKRWTVTSGAWGRRLQKPPHVRQKAALPSAETVPIRDLEASLRAEPPENYVPGEPSPRQWKEVEQGAMDELKKIDELSKTGELVMKDGSLPSEYSSHIDDFERLLRKWRSRAFTLEWAKKNDPRFYQRLEQEGQAGWDKWLGNEAAGRKKFYEEWAGASE
jgi:hypothetical protein